MIQNLSPEDAIGPIVAIIIMLLLWQGFKTWRTFIQSKADATKVAGYQKLVTQVNEQQEATAKQLEQISLELAEMKRVHKK
ncbi:hypothetical protein [Shimazuella kribbensis]|uniref:hypothetical protein n=1 Tax=Shimazuella kribbensis TaxID=139808 RepID=UPI000403E022|nr:hypothetical protein [Shimazuella kribbensis]